MINKHRLPMQWQDRTSYHQHMTKMQHYQYQHPKNSYIRLELLALSANPVQLVLHIYNDLCLIILIVFLLILQFILIMVPYLSEGIFILELIFIWKLLLWSIGLRTVWIFTCALALSGISSGLWVTLALDFETYFLWDFKFLLINP